MSSSAQATSGGEKVSIRPSSSASPFRSLALIGRISMAPFQRDLHQLKSQIGIVDASSGRAFGKARVWVEIAVGIHINNIGNAPWRESNVDSTVVPAVERLESCQRRCDYPRLHRWVQDAQTR